MCGKGVMMEGKCEKSQRCNTGSNGTDPICEFTDLVSDRRCSRGPQALTLAEEANAVCRAC